MTDAMQHAPVENMIFNSYKTMLANAQGEEKKFLKKMGHTKYHKIVKDMLKRKTNPVNDAALCAVQTMHDVVALIQSARRAFGKARLTTATKSTEFMRTICGDDDSEIAAGGGYYCQACGTQPKLDYHWTVGLRCGSLSGWFCANEGCPYDTERMAGLITFADKNDAAGSFVMNTRMPGGSLANMLAAMKLVNLIRIGECALTREDLRKAGGLGPALRSMIGNDNERYSRLFGKLLGVSRPGYLQRPKLDEHQYPDFELCEGSNHATLRTEDYGRGYVMYDVAKLFDGDEPAEPSDGAWRGIVQTVVSAWGIAEAAAIQPEEMNRYTSCSKKTLRKLQTWTFIRNKGCYPPDDDDSATMTDASDAEKAWAAKSFDAW